jgi:glycosyltransferase involved in cell wall biosynthesis
MRLGLDLLFLVPGQTGGRETYARELFTRVRARRPDWRITGFVGREARGPGWWRDVCDEVVVVGAASGRDRGRWALGELVLLPRAVRRAGVEVLHSPANFGPLLGSFARVLTLHDVTWLRVPEATSTLARRLTTAMVLPAVRRADRIVVPSEASRDDAVALLGASAARIDVIRNGTAIPVPGDAAAGRAVADVPAGVPVVLCVASNLAHKNLRALVEAVGRLQRDPRPVLVLAGQGTEQLAGTPYVRALGGVPADVVEDLYAAADLFVLPTLYEGFGIPVAEAMARGVAVACSDVPALREVAGNAALFFDPRDVASITAAVAAAIVPGPERDDRVAAGRRGAEAYSWDTAADALVATYELAHG